MNSPVTNQDHAELQKFSQLAHEWWDPDGPMWTLHRVNPLRSQFIDSYIHVADEPLLDVGCGAGLLTEAMAFRGAKTIGLDLSAELLEVARKHSAQHNLNIDYIQKNVETLAMESPAQFTVVTCMEMLEHVPDPASIVKAISDLLKPDGYGFFSTINRQPSAFFQAILGAEYIMGMIPRGTHSYERFIKPSELARWCRKANLEVLGTKGIQYNPLTKTFSLGQKTHVNYLLAVRKLHA